MVTDYNFSEIEFIWNDEDKSKSKIIFSIQDLDGMIRTKHSLSIEELTYNENYINDTECEVNLLRSFKSVSRFFDYYRKNPDHIFYMLTWYYFMYCLLRILIFIIKTIVKIVLFVFNLFFSIFGIGKSKECNNDTIIKNNESEWKKKTN